MSEIQTRNRPHEYALFRSTSAGSDCKEEEDISEMLCHFWMNVSPLRED